MSMIQAIHTAVPGRARFRVEGLYRSQDLQRLLHFRLAQIKEITQVSASALTGNLLVCFNSGNTNESIAALLEGIVSECRTQLSTGNGQPLPPQPAESPDASSYSFLEPIRSLFSFVEEKPREPWHLLDRVGSGEVGDFQGPRLIMPDG